MGTGVDGRGKKEDGRRKREDGRGTPLCSEGSDACADASGADSGFSDITASYQVPAINWAKAEGILRGVTETEYLPGGALTRQDFAVILHRLHGFPASDQTLDSFRDAEDISEYAKAAMRWAVELGLLRGRSSEELCPRDPITRAELVTLLLRYQNLSA